MAFVWQSWRYQTQAELNGIRYYGYAASYTGGGAVQVSHSII